MAEDRQIRCPDCDSPRITLGLDYPYLSPDEYVCHECGVRSTVSLLMETVGLGDSSERACPHCGKVNDFAESEDHEEEWCLECGLDPDKEHSSPEIAHMWRRGSSIQILLDQDAERFRLGTDRGTFLRTACGPLCPEAESCTQDVSLFEMCFRTSLTGQDAGAIIVSRKSRKKKQREAQMYSAKSTTGALLVCAAQGWLAGRLYGTDYQEPHRDSEPGSGTEAIPQRLSNFP